MILATKQAQLKRYLIFTTSCSDPFFLITPLGTGKNILDGVLVEKFGQQGTKQFFTIFRGEYFL